MGRCGRRKSRERLFRIFPNKAHGRSHGTQSARDERDTANTRRRSEGRRHFFSHYLGDLSFFLQISFLAGPAYFALDRIDPATSGEERQKASTSSREAMG